MCESPSDLKVIVDVVAMSDIDTVASVASTLLGTLVVLLWSTIPSLSSGDSKRKRYSSVITAFADVDQRLLMA